MIRMLKTTFLMFAVIGSIDLSMASGVDNEEVIALKIPMFVPLSMDPIVNKEDPSTAQTGIKPQQPNNSKAIGYSDSAECSNAIRASLQSGNGAKEVVAKAVASKINPAEYFVRIAIEMILESLRLQEMAKVGSKSVNAQTALNAGQDMFGGYIQASAQLVYLVNFK